MKTKLKIIVSLLIGLAPFSAFRIFLYRTVLRYKIDFESRVGWANLMVVRHCVISNSKIGNLNRIQGYSFTMKGATLRKLNNFLHFNQIEMETASDIDSRNNVFGTMAEAGNMMKRKENIFFGENSTVTSSHKFDLSEEIVIGKNVVIGGYNSEFWTHGFDNQKIKKTAPIRVLDNVYIASGCILLPGVEIGSGISLSSGTVVPKTISEPGLYFSSKLQFRPHRNNV